MRADFRHTVRFWADRGVDGFRIDVAHGLRKDMSEPYLPWGEIADIMRSDGTHLAADRDDVHEIYAEWRRIFNFTIRPDMRLRRPPCTLPGERGTRLQTAWGTRSLSQCRMPIGGQRTFAR